MKEAENDPRFARRVKESATRVLAFKKKSRELKKRIPEPTPETTRKLKQQLADFGRTDQTGPGMIVAGVMSGTSADGINVALVRIGERGSKLEFKLLGHARVRLSASGTPPGPLCHECVAHQRRRLGPPELPVGRTLCGCRTQYAKEIPDESTPHRLPRTDALPHREKRGNSLAEKSRSLGRAAKEQFSRPELVFQLSLTFGPADMAAGGKGAPLVPLLDYFLYCCSPRGSNRAEHRRYRQFVFYSRRRENGSSDGL